MIMVGISIALHGWPPAVNDAVCCAECCLIKPHMAQHRYMHAWKFPRVTGQMREMSLKKTFQQRKYCNASHYDIRS